MIKVAYHKTKLWFSSQLKLTDVLTELVVTKCRVFYRWLLHSGDCYEVISLRTAEDYCCLINLLEYIFLESCTSGKDDDTFKEV